MKKTKTKTKSSNCKYPISIHTNTKRTNHLPGTDRSLSSGIGSCSNKNENVCRVPGNRLYLLNSKVRTGRS